MFYLLLTLLKQSQNSIMKKIFLLCLVVWSLNVFGQEIGIDYFSTGAGENITVNYTQNIRHNGFTIGLGCNLNSIKQSDDQNNIYYKRLYATKPIHYLNINASYQRYVFNHLEHIHFFAFYNFQMKYSTTRTRMYIPYTYDTTLVVNAPEDGILYKNVVEYFGPFFWLENSIGIGTKVNITDKLAIQQKIGGGIHLIIGDDIKLFKPTTEWEFIGLINIGLLYNIGKGNNGK